MDSIHFHCREQILGIQLTSCSFKPSLRKQLSLQTSHHLGHFARRAIKQQKFHTYDTTHCLQKYNLIVMGLQM